MSESWTARWQAAWADTRYRVGPHGYIHNWIFVGAPGVGARVFHPVRGHGTVVAHSGTKVAVEFDKKPGAHVNFNAHGGVGAKLQATRSGAEERLRGIYGDALKSDGSEWAARHLTDLDRIYAPEIHQLLADNDTRIDVGKDTITKYIPEMRGVRPRGWPEGSTWDTVPGGVNFDHVVLGDDGPHGAHNLAGHETAHRIDAVLRRPSANNAEFFSAYKKITADENVNPYYKQGYDAGMSELFAEAFGTWSEYRDATPAARRQAMAQALTDHRAKTLPGLDELDQVFKRLHANAKVPVRATGPR